MARNALLDEFHLSFFAPQNLSAAEVDAIRRTLHGDRFHAARLATREFPWLDKVHVRLSR